MIEIALARDDLAHRLAGRRPEQPRQWQIVEHARAGHAPRGIENPEWQSAIVEPQRPALAARQIGKGKLGRSRTDQAMLGADAAKIIECGAIARQQEVIAVVDRHADRRVVIRTAAAAGKSGRLVHDDVPAPRREPHRGRQAGETGADDMNRSAHHTRLRNTMKMSFARGRRTRSRGGAKPRATSVSRMT